MAEQESHQVRLWTKAVRASLHRIVSEKQPIDIEEIYTEIEKDPACTPWRKHYWQSSKWAVQAEWKHKVRTYLQAREGGKKQYTYEKGVGWRLVK
ncbi:MAG: hypothetical protein HUU25_00460 [Candidatus Sumerlaeia bacterium]|nr:hypothetical protein [Candidatus Sumerlaeia bacterium]